MLRLIMKRPKGNKFHSIGFFTRTALGNRKPKEKRWNHRRLMKTGSAASKVTWGLFCVGRRMQGCASPGDGIAS